MEDVAYLEEGLDAGADDYVSKPFDIRALAARVKGLLKRRTGAIVSELRIGNLMLKPETSSISNGTEEVRLTVKEAALLTYLMRHPNRLFSAQQLLDAVWPSDGSGSTDSVRTWMNLLRRKLARLDEQNLIKTVIGSGYIIETADKKTDKTADKKS
jgi:two-component system OmpR family response regulator